MRVTVSANSGVEEGAIRAVLPAIRRLGEDIVQDMDVHPWNNRTGFLEASTEATVDKKSGKLTIGNKARYANYIEFGTSRMRAFPWMAPALFRNRGKRK